ncbi:MAG: DNA polymerase III subunit gamma/tau, partial [Chlamydiota bacterium]|nr:DNA polymerase III subunit gamma/tau [Chlamydiota bacterium]
MSYLVLARKYRPNTFDEIIGQAHVTRTLTNAIEMDRVAHAYLFSGPRGIGKTSTARVFAKSLNCQKGMLVKPCGQCDNCKDIALGQSMDVLEIDGASHRGIDQVRELRDNAKYSPANSRFKIYIIDEVHMLTQEAFNALLKTLEEPPSHVKFFFATTESHKVPSTILSRCQKFDLQKLSFKDMLDHLRKIAKQEKIPIEEIALIDIARNTDGSLRDAEGLLDQLISFSRGKVTSHDVAAMMGWVPRSEIVIFFNHVLDDQLDLVLEMIAKIDQEGKDLAIFISEWVSHLRDLLVIQICKNPEDLLALDSETVELCRQQSGRLQRSQILQMMELSLRSEERIRFSFSKKATLEALAIRMHLVAHTISIEGLLQKFEKGQDLNTSQEQAPYRVSETTPEYPKKKENHQARIEDQKPNTRSDNQINEGQEWQQLIG